MTFGANNHVFESDGLLPALTPEVLDGAHPHVEVPLRAIRADRRPAETACAALDETRFQHRSRILRSFDVLRLRASGSLGCSSTVCRTLGFVESAEGESTPCDQVGRHTENGASTSPTSCRTIR